MAYQEGDPGHLSVHNTLRDEIADTAAALSVDVVLPDEAVAGQTGHVDAHNLITDALQKIADEAVPDMTRPAVIASATYGGNRDVAPGYEVYNFTGSGSLTVAEGGGGIMEVLVVGGGGGSGNGVDGSRTSAGGGGGGQVVYHSSVWVGDGVTVAIAVGGGGGTGGDGGMSRFRAGDGDVDLTCIGGARGVGGYNDRSQGANGGGGSPWGGPSGSLIGANGGGNGAANGPDGRSGAGGGGGMTARGQDGGYNAATGIGGAGVAYTISGTSVEYGKGGDGGISFIRNPRPKTANTGSGADGYGQGTAAAIQAPDGVVIVKVQLRPNTRAATVTDPEGITYAAHVVGGEVVNVLAVPYHATDDDLNAYMRENGHDGDYVITPHSDDADAPRRAQVGDTYADGVFIPPPPSPDQLLAMEKASEDTN